MALLAGEPVRGCMKSAAMSALHHLRLLRGIYALLHQPGLASIYGQRSRGPGARSSQNHDLPLRCRKGASRPGCQRLGTPASV